MSVTRLDVVEGRVSDIEGEILDVRGAVARIETTLGAAPNAATGDPGSGLSRQLARIVDAHEDSAAFMKRTLWVLKVLVGFPTVAVAVVTLVHLLLLHMK